MKTLSILILNLLIVFSASAHLGHNHKHDEGAFSFEADVPVHNGELDKETLKQLLHEAHEKMEESGESHNHKGRLSSMATHLVNAFNFKELSLKSNRWFNRRSQQKETRDHAMNLVFIFPLSHGVEVLTGTVIVPFIVAPAMAQAGYSTEAISAVVGLGGLITLPTGIFDPLCAMMLVLYPLKPVNKMVQKIRLSVFWLGAQAYQKLGIQGLLQKFFYRQDRLQYFREVWRDKATIVTTLKPIEESSGKEASVIISNSLIYLRLSNGTVQFNFKSEGGNWYLSHMRVPFEVIQSDLSKSDRQLLYALGWNAKNAVIQSIKKLKNLKMESLSAEPHIKHIKVSEKDVSVEFIKFTLLQRAKLKTVKSCKNNFSP